MTTIALIVAAGSGRRAGGPKPKQWQTLNGRAVVLWSIQMFQAHPLVDRIMLAAPADGVPEGISIPDGVEIVTGGGSRAETVQNCLRACPDAKRVLIHDAARPAVTEQMITDVIVALETHDGAAPALPVVDALWTGKDGVVTGAADRSGLFRAQTPQGFQYSAILAAHAAYTGAAADDVEVARAAGLDVAIVAGDPRAMKITNPTDLARVEHMMKQGTTSVDIRLGNGYDVHKFGPGTHVTLCGLEIAHDHGLVGHSDADVGMHAVTDAIYGALARGDIGQHFPPSDPQWKGAASDIFLRHAVALASEMGFTISNVDCTLVCEFPKIGPHAQAMREKMSKIMGLDADRISVKATTSERLGFTGRGEGIASIATATLVAS